MVHCLRIHPGLIGSALTYLPPLGQRPWALNIAIWAAGTAIWAPPDALLCIWLTSRCTFVHLAHPFVHLAYPFVHLALPGGIPRGPYEMSELPIENPDEYGDSSSMGGTS